MACEVKCEYQTKQLTASSSTPRSASDCVPCATSFQKPMLSKAFSKCFADVLIVGHDSSMDVVDLVTSATLLQRVRMANARRVISWPRCDPRCAVAHVQTACAFTLRPESAWPVKNACTSSRHVQGTIVVFYIRAPFHDPIFRTLRSGNIVL